MGALRKTLKGTVETVQRPQHMPARSSYLILCVQPRGWHCIAMWESRSGKDLLRDVMHLKSLQGLNC